MCAYEYTTIDIVEPRRTTLAWRSKYNHQTAATEAKPSTAAAPELNPQLVPDVAIPTATTDSPRTISVNKAQRSGRWLALTGMRRWSLVESGGRLNSITCATTQTT